MSSSSKYARSPRTLVMWAGLVSACLMLGTPASPVAEGQAAPAAPAQGGAGAPAPAPPGAGGQRGQGAAGGRVQGPGGNPFPGQTPVNALLVTGGCCHDYIAQSAAIMDTLNAVMPVTWTVLYGLASVPDGKLPLYENPKWAAGFDIVVHNECWANGDLPAQVVQNITSQGVPRMFFHCTLHSYRVMTNDGWRELIGMTSRRHTAAHNIQLKWAEGDPITDKLPPFVTPIDELYVIEKAWPGSKALATAVSPEDGHETYPVVWTHEYKGSRVFGTSLGHATETFTSNQFKELVVRGFRWALKKDPIALPPPDTGRGRGGRGGQH
jgi:hypothetical protein